MKLWEDPELTTSQKVVIPACPESAVFVTHWKRRIPDEPE